MIINKLTVSAQKNYPRVILKNPSHDTVLQEILKAIKDQTGRFNVTDMPNKIKKSETKRNDIPSFINYKCLVGTSPIEDSRIIGDRKSTRLNSSHAR